MTDEKQTPVYVSTTRVLIRLILLGAGFIAGTVVAVALTRSGDPESWSAIAGSLAVIAASAAAYGAVRVVELERDRPERER